ncbi:hypothetical protein F511_06608 [Dorcoceras hygrometricum]|uniref:Uncharacterized protein n=1 Tax=Dorcoceras hygrometricum TaxID=472368 RepID=A0A2Z7B5K4_9LAMI|nr:hypothetical protein F511_06608 [Dorcoceras hygrometricum]
MRFRFLMLNCDCDFADNILGLQFCSDANAFIRSDDRGEYLERDIWCRRIFVKDWLQVEELLRLELLVIAELSMAKKGGKGKEIVQESKVEIPKGKSGRPPGGAALDTPIRSTTGINLPQSISTRRLDGFCHGWNHLVAVIETSPITKRAAAHGGARRRPAACVSTCVTLNGSGIQLAVGPQPLRLRNHNFGLTHRIMVKRLATSPHDPLGITDSACKNQLVVVSVQYCPFNTYIPIRSTTIDKSRVARDPIAMHTSWRSNSDITSVTRQTHLPKTLQYNQDLGLFHSTNGNHLKSPNEGSSIDHQVTIHLHAQNITMFPTNETWYFTSQMLVSSSGGLILILTAQSTRNVFRMHSDY